MNTPSYTTVIGVDAKHLPQLRLVWPTWKLFKPSLLNYPMIVFYDRDQLAVDEVVKGIDHPNPTYIPWPPHGIEPFYGSKATCKFDEPQRYKMLAGFVHVPAKYVHTRYWLKLDVDTVATGEPDWIDEQWFHSRPVIIAQRWGLTKPANQMMLLDEWANSYSQFDGTYPLNLKPESGASKVGHRRIISWCGFFDASFTRCCSSFAEVTCGPGLLPVPSQDGFQWYMAKRFGWPIERVNMKSRGWLHCSNERNIKRAIAELERQHGFTFATP